jgi:hypothetical protein
VRARLGDGRRRSPAATRLLRRAGLTGVILGSMLIPAIYVDASLGAGAPPVGSSPGLGRAQPSTGVDVPATVTPSADLTVGTTLHHPPPPPPQAPPLPGSAETLPRPYFSFEAGNSGPSEADGVVLTVTGPAGVPLTGTGYGPAPTSPPSPGRETGPLVPCTATPTGLTCPVGHLDPGTSVDFQISGGAVAAGPYTATATISGTIGDAACPSSVCDPDPADDTAADTDLAAGMSVQIELLPKPAPSLTDLRVTPSRFGLTSAAARRRGVSITVGQDTPDGSLSTRTRFVLSKEKPGMTVAKACVRPSRGRRVPPGRRCTRLVGVATFSSPTLTRTGAPGTPAATTSKLGLPTTVSGHLLTPGHYRLSATPGYVNLPASTLTATSTLPLTETIGPGACVSPPLGICAPMLAVIRSGPTVTAKITVLGP